MTQDDKPPLFIPVVEDHDGNQYILLRAVQELAASVCEAFMEQHTELMQSLSSYIDAATGDDAAKKLMDDAMGAIGNGATLPVMLSVLMDPEGKRFDGMSYADIKEVFSSTHKQTGERSIH